jgi:CRISP-associated protein Cas1
VRLRRAQYRALDDAQLKLEIARGIVVGKLSNQKAVLLRARRSGDVDETRAGRLSNAIAAMRRASRAARRAGDLETLRGHEGEGAASYFGVFDDLLLNRDFSFSKRTRRPATDAVNAMLGFGYALLAKDAASAASFAGLDPFAGFLHGERYNQPSLALDLMEEFRPVLVDAVVLALVNRRQVEADGFEVQLGGAVHMDAKTRRTFVRGYEERKRTPVLHPIVGNRMEYDRALKLQARVVAKVLLGELERYVPFLTK